MNVLIVEDEPLVVQDLKGKLGNLGYNDISSADNVLDALESINSKEPGVVLVDIELKGAKDGIDLGARLNELSIPFIYLSNLQDMNTFERARKTHPASNIPKPIGLLQLRNCLLEITEKATSPKKFISVSYHGKKYKIDRNDILFLKAAGNNCDIYTLQKKEVSSTPMNNVLEKLADSSFIKVHRSCVVNLNHVKYYEGNMIFLNDYEDPIQMSEKYKGAFMQNFDIV
jgi:DNA-binding LytR/AlgR family response regulator